MKILPIVFASGLAAIEIACAQSVEKTIYFAHVTQELPLLTTAIGMISKAEKASLDADQHSVTLKGTPEQMALAEWLVKSVDVSTNGPGDPNVGAPYRVSGADDSVRVFYLNYTDGVQQAQEVATLIRTIAEIRLVAVYQPQKALMVRGTEEQLAMTDWISSRLARHEMGQASDGSDFHLAAVTENVMRLFWVKTATDVRAFQTMATALRSTTEIRRVFTYNQQKAIAVRGTADQIALADLLIHDLDQPAHVSVPHPTGAKDLSVAQVFFLRPLPPGSSPWSDPELDKTAADLRSAGNNVFVYPPTRAIVVRSSGDQLAAVAKMLEGKLLASAQ